MHKTLAHLVYSVDNLEPIQGFDSSPNYYDISGYSQLTVKSNNDFL